MKRKWRRNKGNSFKNQNKKYPGTSKLFSVGDTTDTNLNLNSLVYVDSLLNILQAILRTFK